MVLILADLQVGYEALLGTIAITSFLVGFSTVRSQASLQDWRASQARILDRLLSENEGDDLLPLPSTLRVFAHSSRSFRFDTINTFTQVVALISGWALLLIFGRLYEGASEDDQNLLEILGLLSVGILVIGLLDVALTRLKARRERRFSPTQQFVKLERDLQRWAQSRDSRGYLLSSKIANRFQNFETMVPDWCWLSILRLDISDQIQNDLGATNLKDHRLVDKVPFSATGIDYLAMPLWLARLAMFPSSSHELERAVKGKPVSLIPHAKRTRTMASKTKHEDSYSLIAWVWTYFLIDQNFLDDEEVVPSIDDLHKIAEHRSHFEDTFADLCLRCAIRHWESRGLAGWESLHEIEAAMHTFGRKKWKMFLPSRI
jgi:hypothetical protein